MFNKVNFISFLCNFVTLHFIHLFISAVFMTSSSASLRTQRTDCYLKNDLSSIATLYQIDILCTSQAIIMLKTIRNCTRILKTVCSEKTSPSKLLTPSDMTQQLSTSGCWRCEKLSDSESVQRRRRRRGAVLQTCEDCYRYTELENYL